MLSVYRFGIWKVSTKANDSEIAAATEASGLVLSTWPKGVNRTLLKVAWPYAITCVGPLAANQIWHADSRIALLLWFAVVMPLVLAAIILGALYMRRAHLVLSENALSYRRPFIRE